MYNEGKFFGGDRKERQDAERQKDEAERDDQRDRAEVRRQPRRRERVLADVRRVVAVNHRVDVCHLRLVRIGHAIGQAIGRVPLHERNA